MIAQREFGKTKEGKSVTLFSLKNKNGMQADVMDYGANLVNLLVPDREGNVADVCLGYDNLEAYFDNSSFFGATVGPVANRTADAKFEIGGVEYQLDVNDNQNNLHSHFEKGLHKILKKVGEESTEMVIAAKNGVKDETVGEICDLIYHTLVMMANEGITPDDVDEELRKRAEKAGNLKKFHVVDKNS